MTPHFYILSKTFKELITPKKYHCVECHVLMTKYKAERSIFCDDCMPDFRKKK